MYDYSFNRAQIYFIISLLKSTFILLRLFTKIINMPTPNFPNGFESWQKTHFEVVEVLCYIRELEEDKKVKSFAEMIDRTATEDMYRLALDLTNKYEEQSKEGKNI